MTACSNSASTKGDTSPPLFAIEFRDHEANETSNRTRLRPPVVIRLVQLQFLAQRRPYEPRKGIGERVRLHEYGKNLEVRLVGKRDWTRRAYGALARRIRDRHSVVDVLANASNRQSLDEADRLRDANAECPAETAVAESRSLQSAQIK